MVERPPDGRRPGRGGRVVSGLPVTGLLVTACAVGALVPWWVAETGGRRRRETLARSRSVGARAGGSDGGPRRGVGSTGPAGAGGAGGDGHPEVDVVVVLELVAAAVLAGAGLPRALQAVGRATGGRRGRALEAVSGGLLLGAGWDPAWDAATGPGAPGEGTGRALDPVRRGLRAAWTDGAAPQEALRAAGADLLHERRSTARTAAARLAVRLVLPLGLCYLPAFVLVGLTPVLLALGLDVLSG